jgi:hypothetical protein
MLSGDVETRTICVLGVAGCESAVELYGVNAAHEVTIHGWFQLTESFLVLADRPRCLIAADAGVLPDEFVRELFRQGHCVIVMPIPSRPGKKRHRRTARELCRLAVGMTGQSQHRGSQTLQ